MLWCYFQCLFLNGYRNSSTPSYRKITISKDTINNFNIVMNEKFQFFSHFWTKLDNYFMCVNKFSCYRAHMYLFTFLLYLDFLNYLPILYYECLENDQATLNQTDPWTKRIQSLLVQYTFLSGIFGTILFIIGHLRYSILFIIGHLRYSILYYRSSSVQYCLLLVMFGTVLIIIGHLLYIILYYYSCSAHKL